VLFMDWSTLAIEIQVCKSDISSSLGRGGGGGGRGGRVAALVICRTNFL
jgi:hypothetical protein